MSCIREVPRTRYYILEYQPVPDTRERSVESPFPVKVLVSNFEIPRSYDSVRIVARESSHEINYYRYNLWAVRPQVVIADLIALHINACHIFERCQREFLNERPDYEITGYIHKIERYDSGLYMAAHLQATYYLYDYSTNDIVARHDFDREEELSTPEFNYFAKKLSDIIEEETNSFIDELTDYFNEKYYPEGADSSALGALEQNSEDGIPAGKDDALPSDSGYGENEKPVGGDAG